MIVFNVNAFIKLADSVIPASLTKNVRDQIRKLDEKIANMEIVPALPPNFVEELRDKLRTQNPSKFSKKECRALCYHADEIAESDDEMYPRIVKVLQKCWNDRYLKSLCHVVLKNWFSVNGMLRAFFWKKLNKYSGSQEKILLWKSNAQFLKYPDGPEQFAKNYPNVEIEKLPEKLALPASFFAADYFQLAAAYAYLEKTEKFSANGLDNLKRILERCDANVQKIIIAHSVCLVAKRDRALEKLAQEKIGYPFSPNFCFLGPNYSNFHAKLKDVQGILKRWIIEDTLRIVFEKAIEDEDRYKFWIQYVDYISDVRIAGKVDVKRIWSFNWPEISETLDHCFVEMSRKGQCDAAILMRIKNTIFVEYVAKGKGCVYVYNEMCAEFPRIKRAFENNRLEGSIEGFKTPNLYKMNKYHAKFAHQGNWQQDLRDWISAHLNIYLENFRSKYQSLYDEILEKLRLEEKTNSRNRYW